MRKNRASNTAKLVTLWRALANEGGTSVPQFSDPYAADMLTGGWHVAYSLFRKQLARMPESERRRFGKRYDPLPMRVAVIDQEMLRAVALGCAQVVILGAGFDTRAYRFPELSGVKLFEVDHPATQSEKRLRTKNLSPPHARLTYTPVDFERDSLGECLIRAGHDARAATVWLWEGVVMYLDDDAVRGTLEAIHARSAPGSVLVLHYHEPSESYAVKGLRGVALRFIGEPQIGLRSRVAMQRLVEEARFVVREDLGILEQAAKVGGLPADSDLARVSRILVAHKP